MMTPAPSLAAFPVRSRWVACLPIAGALMLSACGKTDREPTTEERLKAVQQRQETTTDFSVPRKRVDYLADLKNLKELPPAEKAKPAQDVPAAPVAVPVPIAPAPAPVQTAPARPAASVPTPTPTPVQPPPVQTPAATTPAKPAPAAAASAPAVPRADTAVTVVNRETPSFPREAIRQGIEAGVVRAKLTIGAAGEVTAVTILSARPARVFDREVQSTLSRWRFNPGTDGRSFETEINFQR